jgi:hypothetical protein
MISPSILIILEGLRPLLGPLKFCHPFCVVCLFTLEIFFFFFFLMVLRRVSGAGILQADRRQDDEHFELFCSLGG